ncbi:MAG TPA: DUF6515 family protein [Gammaproteobacteria bacterium]|nr:DUF6515 family protein [Gammaproteobacteria bacterium]
MSKLIVALAGTLVVVACADTGGVQAAGPVVRVGHAYSPGHEVRRLPRGQVRLSVGAARYHYFDGIFYEPHWPGYIIVAAPIGARVRTLPLGYVSFAIGPRSYFYVNSTYYLWEPQTRDYVVVAEPDGATERVAAAQAPSDSVSLFVYPNEGQDAELTRRDRYECHLWAAGQSGYDPTYSGQDARLRSDYRRAMTACLEGRGYTVR